MRWPWLTTRRALDLVGLAIGKVHVDEDALVDPGLEDLAHDLGAVMLGALPLQVALRAAGAVGLRERDRGNAEDRALDGARDGARIGHVLGDVLAAVDAGEHEVGLGLAHEVAHAHDDAIGRRALHGEVPLGDLAQAQRIVERQRMRDAALVGLGRDDPHIVGKLRGDALPGVFSPGAWMPSSLVQRMRMSGLASRCGSMPPI